MEKEIDEATRMKEIEITGTERETAETGIEIEKEEILIETIGKGQENREIDIERETETSLTEIEIVEVKGKENMIEMNRLIKIEREKEKNPILPMFTKVN
jgi:hypothetical protein